MEPLMIISNFISELFPIYIKEIIIYIAIKCI